jgi:peptidoglycan/LPS O-acetylase OafA/YrhL
MKRIATLDGWRAIAVSLVIAAHAVPMLQQTQAGRLVAQVVSHAGFGVDVFFALSGFLICTLLLQEKEAGGISLPAFYVRRAFRIIPPIVVYLCVLMLVLPVSAKEVLASLFFVRNYVDGTWYTGHFWSLAVEEHFYLVVPVVFMLLPWNGAMRAALIAAGCCIIIRSLEAPFLPGMVEFRTEARFDGLMFGAVLALSLRVWANEIRERLTFKVALAVLAVATVLLIVFPAMPVRRTVVAMALPVLIGYTVLRPEELLGRVLDWPVLQWVGRLSYSLYVWQMLFFTPQQDLPVQTFPMALIGTVLCAVLSFYVVEQPATNYGRSLSRRIKDRADISSLPRIAE